MVYLGADHRGFELKEQLKHFLIKSGHKVEDLGANEYDKEDDYSDIAHAVADAVGGDENSRGILLCGSGVGVDIVANRHPGVRCALSWKKEIAEQSRKHEDINMLAIPADHVKAQDAEQIADVFMKTAFTGEERHTRRIGKIND